MNDRKFYMAGGLAVLLSIVFWAGLDKKPPPETTDNVITLANRKYYPFVRQKISQAEKEVLVAMYLCSFKDPTKDWHMEYELLDALIKAKQKGLRVRAVFSAPWTGENASDWARTRNVKTIAFLKKFGVDARAADTSSTMHSKLIIIDRKWVIVGSHNWTYSAFKYNGEASVAIRSEKTAEEFIKAFSDIFSEKE